MNDSKYGRLYPERAVALASALLEDLRGDTVWTQRAYEAQQALERLGFPPDEPLFVLRGQDVLAPETVQFYFDLQRGAGLPVDALHVGEHVSAMLNWQPRKLPD